jgi:hypothetical protein
MSLGEQVAGAVINLFVLAVLVALALALYPHLGVIAIGGAIALVTGWIGLLMLGITRGGPDTSMPRDDDVRKR